jgi:hypothetical protein
LACAVKPAREVMADDGPKTVRARAGLAGTLGMAVLEPDRSWRDLTRGSDKGPVPSSVSNSEPGTGPEAGLAAGPGSSGGDVATLSFKEDGGNQSGMRRYHGEGRRGGARWPPSDGETSLEARYERR